MGASSSQNPDDPITEINMTPLVDVALVLVIIFMAVAPFAMQAGIKVLQSKSKVSQVGKKSVDDSVKIKLTKDGVITINGARTDMEHFGAMLNKIMSARKDKFVIIKADVTNKVGDVVSLLDAAKQNGAGQMALMRN